MTPRLRYGGSVRLFFALVVFVALCAGVAVVADVHDENLRGYVLLCLFLLLPAWLAVFAYVKTRLDDARWPSSTPAPKERRTLPEGVEWIYPQRPARSSPDADADADAERAD